MRTARDERVWKVRVLIRTHSIWTAKTFFYSREVFAKRWKARADNNDNIEIDFYGKYTLTEEHDVS